MILKGVNNNFYGNGRIGKETTMGSFCDIGGCVIGDNCKIQSYVFIPSGVEIGDDCFIGPHVCFTNDKKPPSDNWSKTIVKKGAVIGAGAIILPGITIGENSIIGAGAVVTKDTLAGKTYVGNPAKEL